MTFLNTALHCPTCNLENILSVATGELVEEKNYSFFEMKCQNGHTFYETLIYPDYGYYLMNGLASFNSGNYFESFNSIYYAYERFKYTFCETILLESNKTQSYDDITKKAKKIKSNSLETDGAFQALYSIRFDDVAPEIPRGDREIRNRYFHGIEAPSKKNVEKVFTDIIKFINQVECDLCPPKVKKELEQQHFEFKGEHRTFSLAYPILDLVFAKSTATHNYLEKNKGASSDLIEQAHTNYSVGGKNIIPVGNQMPVDLDDFNFNFGDMTRAFERFKKSGELFRDNPPTSK